MVLSEADDTFTWKWCANGCFSSRSACMKLFEGTVLLEEASLVWNSFVSMRFKFHAWLSLQKRCWSADRLIRHGLPSHVDCPLCAVEIETLDSLSLQCRFSSAIWFCLISRRGWPVPLPGAHSSLPSWWPAVVASSPASTRKDINSFNLFG